MRWALIACLAFAGCGSWQVRAADSAQALIDGAHAACDTVKRQCIRNKDRKCERLKKCEAMETSVVAGGKALSDALHAAQRAETALKQWKGE